MTAHMMRMADKSIGIASLPEALVAVLLLLDMPPYRL
jgi:hypothetical protein